MKIFRTLKNDEAGATAIEYGLIAALIAVAAITALTSLGSTLSGTFAYTDAELAKGIANGAGGTP